VCCCCCCCCCWFHSAHRLTQRPGSSPHWLFCGPRLAAPPAPQSCWAPRRCGAPEGAKSMHSVATVRQVTGGLMACHKSVLPQTSTLPFHMSIAMDRDPRCCLKMPPFQRLSVASCNRATEVASAHHLRGQLFTVLVIQTTQCLKITCQSQPPPCS
jgi:hypothetical protein